MVDVDGTDIHGKPIRDKSNDPVEGMLGAAGFRDDLENFLEYADILPMHAIFR
jgi:hypothetical protein